MGTNYNVRSVVLTSFASPTQWEARDEEDRPLYARYRFGYLSVTVGEPGQTMEDAVLGREIFSEQLGELYDGVLSYEGLKAATRSLIEWPDRPPEVAGPFAG